MCLACSTEGPGEDCAEGYFYGDPLDDGNEETPPR